MRAPAIGDAVMVLDPTTARERQPATVVGVQEPLPLGDLPPATLYELEWCDGSTSWHAPVEFGPVVEVRGWLW